MKYLIPLLLIALSVVAHAENVRIEILDRGQADGFVIRTPNHKWIVIDAGTNKQQADLLKSRGVEVELAVVSHSHRDHQGGMDEILNDIPVKRFVGITDDCPGVVSDDKVREKLTTHNTQVVPLQDTPKPIVIDGVTFTILPLPDRSTCPSKENMNSILVRMDYGEFSMLFTGDVEEEALDWYVEHHPGLLNVDILKASHHGSNNGYTTGFLSAVTPNKIVISAGVHGGHKHPMKQAMKDYKLATNDKVYCTNRHKTLRVYGYEDGRSRVYRQNTIDKPCEYDGTHY